VRLTNTLRKNLLLRNRGVGQDRNSSVPPLKRSTDTISVHPSGGIYRKSVYDECGLVLYSRPTPLVQQLKTPSVQYTRIPRASADTFKYSDAAVNLLSFTGWFSFRIHAGCNTHFIQALRGFQGNYRQRVSHYVLAASFGINSI
jgi:hypothetical protein